MCDDCSAVCPIVVPDEYDEGMAYRRAIYVPFPQAIPSSYTIDTEHCLGFDIIACGECQKVCKAGAINYDKVDELIEEEIGAVILSTGYNLYPVENIPEYGYGKFPDVVNGLQFERILSATGPTGGEVLRPSDGKVPKDIVFIQCSGSRDPHRHNAYCSKICCMYTLKHAKLFKHKVHDGQTYIFYIDIRSGGKRYEEFVQNTVEDDGIVYIRGKVAKVYQEGEKMIVHGMDTLTGHKVEIEADMVVLAQSMVPSFGSKELFKTLKVGTDGDGFLAEAHPKLKPLESLNAGFYLAGAASGPKDIPDAVAQASGAAAKAIALMSKDEILHEPIIAAVDETLCSGCSICIGTCPYGARVMNADNIAEVNDILCEGCGACISACPSGASQQMNLTDNQIENMINVILG
jgi:heterodisulfide reductase subunit A